MLIVPQQHCLTGSGAVEPARLDQPGGQPGPISAFVRFQRAVAGGDHPQPCDIQIHRWPAHGR